jgi:dTDP-4-dehydrorhamnose reductase
MHVLITGADGQVGRAICHEASNSVESTGLSRAQLDITDSQQVTALLRELRPDLVINAAAYTAVDRAESETELAMRVNRDGVANLGLACATAGIAIIHFSTDYVFGGNAPRPYREQDQTGPVNAYGRSKLAGEMALRATTAQHVILRTSWVYSAMPGNFVTTMVDLMQQRDALSIVDDQIGNPTCARALARACLALGKAMINDETVCGTYHVTGTGAVSWFGFAEEILAQLQRYRPVHCELDAVSTAQYPTIAQRPANSRLDCSALQRDHGLRLPAWHESLSACMAMLHQEG